jgi:hypothetical protein
VPGPHKFHTKQIAAQKNLQNLKQKWESCSGILWHFGANSAGTFKASVNHNKQVGT